MVKHQNLIPGGAAKKIDGGHRVMLTLPDDVHEFIKSQGGSKWLVKLLRSIRASQEI